MMKAYATGRGNRRIGIDLAGGPGTVTGGAAGAPGTGARRNTRGRAGASSGRTRG